MDSPTQYVRAAAPLPAQRLDAGGRAHVDQRAVMALALPLMANSAVQIVLNLTDMWFMGRISTKALAAVGAVQWLIVAAMLVLGGAGLAVQTLVAQYSGARRYRRAGQAVWTAMWAMACAAPLFVLVGAARHVILAPFGFDPQIEALASAFWFPRMGGAFVGAAVWALFGFFNGIGEPRVTLVITVVITLINALLNQLFIFNLGWGIVGSAWATNAAQLLGLLFGAALLLRRRYRREYRTHLSWRPHGRRLAQQLRLGVPMGVSPAADLLGFAIFQMMQTRLGTVGGAATQMVVILTSLAYMPGFGIASAGTTLVGQSIGAGARGWAQRVGNHVILLAALYMGGIGVLIALAGPWLLPFFAGAHDADSAAAVALGVRLLWLAAGYQFFDGLNLGSSMCLRGAGDVRVPAALVLPVSLLLFVPLAHALTFAPGQGWVHFLPQFGFGATGGWVAVLIYVMVLGMTLFLRWRSRAWQSIRI
jgi:MATE family multidrug resistance protein